MQSRVKLAMKLPKEVNQTDMMTMLQTVGELPDDLRNTFLSSLKQHMESAGMPLPPMPDVSSPSPTPPTATSAAPKGPGDMIRAQEEMMKQLASASEEMRRTALKGRWDEILRGSDESLGDALKVMMRALANLPDEQRRTVTRARTEVIGSLTEDEIKRILAARARATKDIQNIDNEDRMISMEEMAWVPQGPRMRFSNAMVDFMKSMGMLPPPMPSTPVHHGKPMEQKGFFSKSWKCQTCGRGFPAM